MSVNIKYKNNSIAELSDTGTKTLKTAGKYCEADIIVENTKDGITPSGNKAITATTSTQTGIDVTNYATVSVAPTPSEIKSVTTNGDVTPSSGKLLSKVTVNVPTGTARDSSDLTVSGATVNVPAGLYSSAASKSVASGTAGTPTASKSAVSNNSVTVTPSVTNTEGYISGGTKTGTGVKVSASELVSGNKALTPSSEAQAGIDVANYSTVSVGAITKELLASLDADFVAENIKKDVDLFGLIGALEAGGGGGGNFATGTFTTTDDITSNVVINHNLGVKPKFIIVVSSNAQAYTRSSPPLLSFYYIYEYDTKIYGHKYQNPNSKYNEFLSGQAYNSSSATAGAWYRVNVDETTFTLKQANISSTYGIGASCSFFWLAYGE